MCVNSMPLIHVGQNVKATDSLKDGVLAQLVERCVRIAEVRGSNPLSSTRVGSVELFFFRNEFALVYRFGSTR